VCDLDLADVDRRYPASQVNVLVCIKQALTLDDEIVFTDDGIDVDRKYVEGALNEWDSFAVEEALRMREAHGGSVTVATYGDSVSEAVLRRALAMGANRAIRIEGNALDPYSIGSALRTAADLVTPDLILCGAQSSDSAQAATGTVLAGLLNWPCASVARAIRLETEAAAAIIDRELEGGVVQRVRFGLPVVITVQTGINQPRYASLRAIKLAEKEQIEVLHTAGVRPAYRIRRMFVPPQRGNARPLGADLQEAAARIAELIKEPT
jgi:electron transfer flavoprotein beta subunit